MSNEIVKKIVLTDAQWLSVRAELESGHAVLVGEYRGLNVSSFNGRDEFSGAERVSLTANHSVEARGRIVVVPEKIPDGADGESVKAPTASGAPCAVILRSCDLFPFGQKKPRAVGRLVPLTGQQSKLDLTKGKA